MTQPQIARAQLVLLLAGLVTASALVWSSAQASATFTFAPVADSYVQSDLPTTNFGSSTKLRVDGSPTAVSYLRFTVSGTSGSVTNATLRVFATSDQSVGYDVYGVSGSPPTFDESSLVSNNAPTLGSKIGSSGATTANTWTDVNVTSLVTGDGTYEVGLKTTSVTALALSSGEAGANAPQLVVTTSGTDSPPSAPVNTPLSVPVNGPLTGGGGGGGSITLVQEKVGSGSDATLPVTLTSPSVAGHALVAVVALTAGSSASVNSVTDSAGGTWMKGPVGFLTGTNSRVEIWYRLGASSVTSLTVTLTAAKSAAVNVSEWSGVASASAVDGSSGVSGASSTSVATPTLATTNANDLVIGAINFPATATSSLTSGTFSRLTDLNASTRGRAAYAITSTSGSYQATWTLSAPSGGNGGAILALKAGASSTPLPPATTPSPGPTPSPAPTDTTAPSVPTGLAVSAAQASLSLGWSASTDAVGVAGYDVFLGGLKVSTSAGPGYRFGGLICGTKYTLAVDAFDAAGNVSQKASVSSATSPCGGSGGSSSGSGVLVGNRFYVSPTGSDTNPGTIDQPWRTIKKAMATLIAGQTAYLRAGVYQENLSGSCGSQFNKLAWTASGTSSAPITISGYPGEERQVVVQTAIKLVGNYQRLEHMVVDHNLSWSPSDSSCDGGPNVNVWGLYDTVRGVEVRNSAMSGIYLEGATGAQLLGNWIHGDGTHWNLDHGIYWFSGPNGVVADNIVQDNYAYGIKVGPDAQSVLVTENTVNGNGRSGIIVSGDSTYVSSNNTIANNIITWNGYGSSGGYGIRTYWETAGVGTGNKSIGNLIYGNGSGNTWWSGGGMTDSGSILTDPLFVNRSAGDFHLQSGSPAIDAAVTVYAVSPAFDGTARPQGAAPDLGAYER